MSRSYRARGAPSNFSALKPTPPAPALTPTQKLPRHDTQRHYSYVTADKLDRVPRTRKGAGGGGFRDACEERGDEGILACGETGYRV